jgi:hypothetical protein
MGLRGGQANSPSRSQTGGAGRGRGTSGGTAQRGTQSSLQPGGGHTRRDSNRRQSGRHNLDEMSESQVVGFLGRKIWQAMNDEDGDISDNREENFNYYIGQEYGNEREGYSKFVTREALETVEWVLPSVLRVFLSGDKIVAFEAQGPEDEKAAEQETDIANYFVMRANNGGQGGFLPLHHWMKDCLMYPNGYLKVYMEEKTTTDVGTVSGLTEIGVAMLEEDDDVEIIEQRSRMVQITPQQPAGAPAMPGPPPGNGAAAPGVVPGAPPQASPPPGPMGVGGQPDPNMPPQAAPPIPPEMLGEPPQAEQEVFDLKIRTTKQVMELRIDPVPPEECLVDNDTVTLNLDEADFVCHRVRKTYTLLVNEGFDPDELDQVGLGEDYQWNDERVNRLFYEDEDPDAEDEDDPSMRTFWVHECHAWFDFEGLGTAQHRRVTLIGDRVFENVETNYQPLIAMSAILMQHKHTGMGYIDIMKDLQILQSVLTRQLLDNIYKINVRRKVFSEDALTEDGSTMEAILNVQAEFIPVRGPAANAFVPEPTQSIIGELLPVIQHFTQQTTVRTGVAPDHTLDPNALQEIRQDVYNNAMDRASQRIEMLVRIFAETGYRQLMCKVHQLLRSHWDIARTIKLRGEWVDVDPQAWRQRTDMSVEVGLGFSTKNQQLGLLTQLIAMQKEAAAQGMSSPAKIYNTLEKMVAAGGIGTAKNYFIDPESAEFQPPEPPPPDPNAILAQAQAEALKSEQERKGQEFQVKAQGDMQKMQYEQQKSQAEAADKQQDRELKTRELALKELELKHKGALAEGELEAKIENIRADSLLKEALADKAMADGAAVAVEASETFRDAVKIVSQGAELNEGEALSAEFESDGDTEGSAEHEAEESE